MNADLAIRRARAHRLLRAALLWEERRALERQIALSIFAPTNEGQKIDTPDRRH